MVAVQEKKRPDFNSERNQAVDDKRPIATIIPSNGLKFILKKKRNKRQYFAYHLLCNIKTQNIPQFCLTLTFLKIYFYLTNKYKKIELKYI